ncbi:phosphatase PAP2 family protein [Nocardia sp. NPDC050710]|uniref:phosphatase PAP2 family protein n=1 Tax=Nocardia sp. NPDC050710 TaxID=3157220 RepID=UPI00340E9A1E
MIAAPRAFGTIRLTVVALCVAIAAAVPLSFPADGGATDVDRGVSAPIHEALDRHHNLYHALVVPSDAYILLPLLLAAGAWFAAHLRWWRAVTMVVVPELVVAINTWVLKPLFDRPLHDYLAYPSGHTVHLIAIATTFALLTDSAAVRYSVATVTAAALGAVAVGMIGLGYHLPTDIVGGVSAAIAMVVILCWVAQRIAHRIQRAPG